MRIVIKAEDDNGAVDLILDTDSLSNLNFVELYVDRDGNDTELTIDIDELYSALKAFKTRRDLER